MCVIKLEATPNRMRLSRIELLKATPKHCDRVLFCRINIKNYSFGICNFLEWKEKTWLLLITINAKRGGVENLSHCRLVPDLSPVIFIQCVAQCEVRSMRLGSRGWWEGGRGEDPPISPCTTTSHCAARCMKTNGDESGHAPWYWSNSTTSSLHRYMQGWCCVWFSSCEPIK